MWDSAAAYGDGDALSSDHTLLAESVSDAVIAVGGPGGPRRTHCTRIHT